ncbi:MAG: hypothetical protein ACP5J1_03145 [Fervidicoccaceae archaeon]
MPIVSIKLTEEEFNLLKTKAASKGFESISDYVKNVALSEQRPLSQPTLTTKEIPEREPGVSKEKELVQSIARAVQDIVNPFTAKIDELARSVAELRERIDRLEEAFQKVVTESEERGGERKTMAKPARGGTAIERLSMEGVVFQSELTWLKNPKAFFDKLKREGAIVIELEGEYIAVDPEFWDNFQSKLSAIKERDSAKVAKSLPDKMSTLFRKLLSGGKLAYDPAENAWRISL